MVGYSEPQKVWHYQIVKGIEKYCIARTKGEALEKIHNKEGCDPIELYWRVLYNPKETTYPKGTIL